MSYKLDMSKI